MDSNRNKISLARDMEGKENPSDETVKTWQNDKKRTLECSVPNVWMKKIKVMSIEDQLKWLFLNGRICEWPFPNNDTKHASILMETSILSNLDQPQTEDDFIIVPLTSKNKSLVDVSPEKVQQKL